MHYTLLYTTSSYMEDVVYRQGCGVVHPRRKKKFLARPSSSGGI